MISNQNTPQAMQPAIEGQRGVFNWIWWRFFASLQTAGQPVRIGKYTIEVAANGDLVVIRPSGGTVVIATP